jgi:hypothetical protein
LRGGVQDQLLNARCRPGEAGKENQGRK